MPRRPPPSQPPRAATTRDWDEPSPGRTVVTQTGVPIIVRQGPPPTPVAEPAPEPEGERREVEAVAVSRPPPRSLQERDAIMRELEKEHRAFLHRVVCRELMSVRGEVVEESTEDIAQRVRMVLARHVVDHGVPMNVPGYLTRVAQYEVRNHCRVWAPPLARDVDADAQVASAPDPEAALLLAHRRPHVERCLRLLPKPEAQAFEHIVLRGMSYAEASTALQRPVGTLGVQVARARAALEELVRESERAAALGAPRRRPK